MSLINEHKRLGLRSIFNSGERTPNLLDKLNLTDKLSDIWDYSLSRRTNASELHAVLCDLYVSELQDMLESTFDRFVAHRRIKPRSKDKQR